MLSALVVGYSVEIFIVYVCRSIKVMTLVALKTRTDFSTVMRRGQLRAKDEPTEIFRLSTSISLFKKEQKILFRVTLGVFNEIQPTVCI